jgi:hypothetical protein
VELWRRKVRSTAALPSGRAAARRRKGTGKLGEAVAAEGERERAAVVKKKGWGGFSMWVAGQRIPHLPRAVAACPHPIGAKLLEESRRGMAPACGSGKRAQRRGGAGPRPATGGRPAREKQRRGRGKRGEELTCGPRLAEGEGESGGWWRVGWGKLG